MNNMYASRLPQVSASTFSSIIPYGSAILAFFGENPALLERPYSLNEVYRDGRWLAVNTAAYDNPVVAGLHSRSVDIDAISPERDFPDWADVIFPDPPSFIGNRAAWIAMNIRSFALVDLAIYYVRIANIYAPNSSLIKNVYATNVETDAIGRVNESLAQQAVKKIVRRYGISPLDETRVADHLLLLMKHESSSTWAPSASRGIAFERECCNLLSASGFDVRETPKSGDFGADIIASKDGLSFATQCKDTSKPVGVKAVQEAVSARSHYRVDFAAVCSTAKFTDAAIELSTSNNVILSSARNLVARLEAI